MIVLTEVDIAMHFLLLKKMNIGPILLLAFVSVLGHLHEDEYHSLSFVTHVSDTVDEKAELIALRDDVLGLSASVNDHSSLLPQLERSVAELLQRRDDLCEIVSSSYHSRSNSAHDVREKLNQNHHLSQQGGRIANNFIRAAQENAIELHKLEKLFEVYVTASRACDAILTSLQRVETRIGEMRSASESASEL